MDSLNLIENKTKQKKKKNNLKRERRVELYCSKKITRIIKRNNVKAQC